MSGTFRPIEMFAYLLGLEGLYSLELKGDALSDNRLMLIDKDVKPAVIEALSANISDPKSVMETAKRTELERESFSIISFFLSLSIFCSSFITLPFIPKVL